MANELESSYNEEIEAVAEEQVELDEFKASGENSEIADPVVKGSNKRPADKTVGFTAPNPCLLYTSPSPRDKRQSRMPSSA